MAKKGDGAVRGIVDSGVNGLSGWVGYRYFKMCPDAFGGPSTRSAEWSPEFFCHPPPAILPCKGTTEVQY